MSSWFLGGCVLIALAVFSDAASVPIPNDSQDTNVEVPADQWFQQLLDHFNITDNREWKQRYQVITKHYQKGGPAFIEFGGEWKISGKYLLRASVTEFAKKYHAIVFQLEHRFYGLSHPTSDVSLANLHYLSADQALADAAYFIMGMNKEHQLPTDTKWVAFGGSYAANLAAWMRDKYSHLVYAAVADSGPILAKVNFFEYLDVVKKALGSCSPDCVTAIQEAHSKFKELLTTSEGECTVKEKFKLCDPIDSKNKNDKYSLLAALSDNLASVIQYNGSSTITVNQVCDIMLNKSVDDIIDRYAQLNALLIADEGEECLDFKYEKFVEEMKNTSWEAKRVTTSARQWVYQTCTEYGYYQTSVNQDHLFYEDVPLYLPLQQCEDIYGEEFNADLVYKGKNRTNILYGGLNGQATRVVYIYSENDPWHILGNEKTVLDESPVILIKGASHCAVTKTPKETTSAEIKDAWNQVNEIVGKWCKQ